MERIIAINQRSTVTIMGGIISEWKVAPWYQRIILFKSESRLLVISLYPFSINMVIDRKLWQEGE